MNIKPIPGKPFAQQSPEFQQQEQITQITGFVLVDPGPATLEKISWYVDRVVEDTSMRQAVKDGVLARLTADDDHAGG